MVLQWDQPQHVFRTYTLIQHSMKNSTYTKSSLRVFGCFSLLLICTWYVRAIPGPTYRDGSPPSYLLAWRGVMTGEQLKNQKISGFAIFCVCRLTDTCTEMVQCFIAHPVIANWHDTACIDIERVSKLIYTGTCSGN